MLINSFFLISIIILTLVNIFIFINVDKLNNLINIYDNPNQKRKIHQKKISKTGGWIIFFNLSVIYLIYFLIPQNDISLIYSNTNYISFYLGCFLFFLLGLIDDIYDLKPNIKLLSALLIVILILNFDNNLVISDLKFSFVDNKISTSSFGVVFTTFCILLFINAFNMFDGINLQSILYSVILILGNLVFSNSLNFIIFLFPLIFVLIILNYKNKIFLGDNGSLLLGFIFSYLFIFNYNKSFIFDADIIFIFMMLPGLELLRLAITRISKKRNPFSADNLHIHHLLLRKYSYRTTLFSNLTLIIIPILIVSYTDLNSLYIISLFIIFYIALILKLTRY